MSPIGDPLNQLVDGVVDESYRSRKVQWMHFPTFLACLIFVVWNMVEARKKGGSSRDEGGVTEPDLLAQKPMEI